MTEQLNDEQIISRLRSALDEVVAHQHTTAPTAPTGPVASAAAAAVQGRRSYVVAIVATVALLGVATGWIIVVRGDQSRPFVLLDSTTRPPGATESSDNSSSVAPTTSVSSAPVQEWYTMRVADLVPGAVTHERCCPTDNGAALSTVTAWAARSGFQDGILLLLAEPTGPGKDALKFMSYGLSDARTSELKNQVIPGSGLPYVLPDPAMELVGFGIDGFGNRVAQAYVGNAGNVTISVGDYRGQLTPIVLGAGLHAVQIAGSTAYRYTDFNGVHFVWRTHAGSWAQLDIDQGVADREAEIIRAVVAVK